MRASLSLLTQISYSNPVAVARPAVKRVVALCSAPDCQELAVKLLCNLVTEDASREQVVKSDGIFGVFHCLVHSQAATLRYALACFLNLTFHPQVANQICVNGGLAHLLGALQRSATDSQATVYGIKALSNLVQTSPSLSIVAAEFGASEQLLSTLQTAPQAVAL